MINVREAVEFAKKYCYEVFQQPGQVEEVDTDNNYWLITLSIPEATMPAINLPTDLQKKLNVWGVEGSKKTYKLFKVDGQSGHVVSAKIRQLN